MKKVLISTTMLVMMLASCTTVQKTASSLDVNNCIKTKTSADLVVDNEKANFTYRPTKKVRKCGTKNVIATAVSEALKTNNNADVLVAPEYEITVKKGFLGKKIKSVTVTGYPAKYKNFRSEK